MNGEQMKKFTSILLAFGLTMAQAANTPCSGKKGGISHCLGQYFICNDGSTSQSKKTCSDESNQKPNEIGKKPKKSPPNRD